MKIIATTLLASALLFVGCSDKTKSAKSKFIKDTISEYKIEKSKKIIIDEFAKRNYQLVSIYKHEENAKKLKTMLYPTYSIEVNNPKISTTLLQCNPTMSVDLPLKVGLYNEINGKTHFTFTDPEYWSLKHNVKDNKCLGLLLLIKRDLNDIADILTKQEDVNETK